MNVQRNYFLTWLPKIYDIIYNLIVRVFNTFCINRFIDELEHIFTNIYTNDTILTI